RVGGSSPTGPRSSRTESAGTLEFTVVNFDATDKDARVVVFYTAQPDVQYARDVWVPARSRIQTWISVGPAPAAAPNLSREIEMRLYDRTGGAERLIPPAGEERVRSRVVFYRKREPTTAVMLDWSPENAFGHRVELHEKDVIDFVTLVRH